jgi:hypothetical protein
MSGSDLCLPINETAQPHYLQTPPNFHIHVCICELFIYSQDRSAYFLSQNEGIGEGRAVSFIGIHKSDFRYSARGTGSVHWVSRVRPLASLQHIVFIVFYLTYRSADDNVEQALSTGYPRAVLWHGRKKGRVSSTARI